jgi:hypothetical protein
LAGFFAAFFAGAFFTFLAATNDPLLKGEENFI